MDPVPTRRFTFNTSKHAMNQLKRMSNRAKNRGITIRMPTTGLLEFNANPENTRYILGTNKPVINVYNEQAMIEHRKTKKQNNILPKSINKKTVKRSKLGPVDTNKPNNNWLKDWVNNNV